MAKMALTFLRISKNFPAFNQSVNKIRSVKICCLANIGKFLTRRKKCRIWHFLSNGLDLDFVFTSIHEAAPLTFHVFLNVCSLYSVASDFQRFFNFSFAAGLVRARSTGLHTSWSYATILTGGTYAGFLYQTIFFG